MEPVGFPQGRKLVLRVQAGWKQTLWDFHGDGKYLTGFPGECIAVLDFYSASTPVVNPTSISFICRTFGACLITIKMQTETSASLVGNFY